MSLKFQRVEWDDKDLMYVEFEVDGQRFRWYPKWEDLRNILQSAIITEGTHGNWDSVELRRFSALFLELRDYIKFEEGVSCERQLQEVEFFPRAIQRIAASGGSH